VFQGPRAVPMGARSVRPCRPPQFLGPQKIRPVIEGPLYSSEARTQLESARRARVYAPLAATSRVWRRIVGVFSAPSPSPHAFLVLSPSRIFVVCSSRFRRLRRALAASERKRIASKGKTARIERGERRRPLQECRY
jgi:hypothetical protein